MIARLARVEWAVIIPAIGLVSAGILILSTTSEPIESPLDSNAVQQAIFAGVGLVGAVLMAFLHYRRLRHVATPAYVLGLVCLGGVLLVGDDSYGARRWFDVGPIVIQPSELMKLALILCLARFLSRRPDMARSLRAVLLSLGLTLAPVGLIFLEPDLGTALVLCTVWLIMVFAAGARWWHLLLPFAIAVAAFPFGWFFAKDYMRERLVTFFDPASDPLGAGYNILQARISVGAGGWLGQGIGQGSQTNLEFLRVRDTDFIFAALGEQLGFVGGLGILLFFSLLITQAVIIALRARDDFGRLIALGTAAMLFVQSFVNIGMNVGLMPVTGLTLPLVSYGRNSMTVTLSLLGILISVSAHHAAAPHRQAIGQWLATAVPSSVRARGSSRR
ncbi:MAG: rod shape-determining protein RodA [Actinobacteria bacterium]|nr:rod shape-determining protein RodA [Actinomycetota bacterium]